MFRLSLCPPQLHTWGRRFVLRRRYQLGKATFSRSKPTYTGDPRLEKLANAIENDFAVIQRKYQPPQNPIVLAHGLLGFNELHVAGRFLPGLHYWRGITEALENAGVTVFTTAVPASGTIEERAEALYGQINALARGQRVNIIAHSMGGLDARAMITHFDSKTRLVASLTTIATPHRGSAIADFVFAQVGERNVPRVFGAMEALGLQTGAFRQLTRAYMCDVFNPATPDRQDVRYFSYGAALVRPRLWSVFRQPHRILFKDEGPNDGLVSVESSQWGGEAGYKGTLVDVSHLDLINWTNRLRWLIWEWSGRKRKFNALAFYLSICDMLAKEGL